ncbi:MAG: RNA 2',3'-cyclic phosphodiesterase [Phycisphaerales bacterium]
MPRRSRDQSQLRLFIAIYPPRELAEAWLGALARFDLADHRLISPEHIHLTVLFVGSFPPRRLDEAVESVERSVAGVRPFELRPERMLTLPDDGALPRLVAIETDLPAALRECRDRLVRRFARHARRRPSERFRPHLTLCRFHRDATPTSLDAPVDGVESAPFRVETVTLVKSTLHPKGARHEVVHRAPFCEK